MPSTLMDYDNDKLKSRSKLSKPRRTSKGPRGKAASQQRLKALKKLQKEMQDSEKAKKAAGSPNYDAVTKGREMLKKMGESGPEIRKHLQMKKARKAGLILAENDEEEITTEPGAVDDDAKERIKRRKKQLEEAAG